MDIIPWNNLSSLDDYRAVPVSLAVGVFDGVHLGHRVVIRKIVRAGSGLMPIIITFSSLPQSILHPEAPMKNLLTVERKLEILGALGVKVAVMIDFSFEFSKMTATSFFESLAAAFQVRKVVEGENFHFGKDRQAGRKALTGLCSAIGASLETADTVYYKNLPVSSTRIRHAVRAGRMEDVRKMISGAYPLDLPAAAVKRDREGRAVIDTGDLIQAVPAQGCYHCRADSGSETEETEVVVAKERIFIRSNLPSVKTLYFEKKIDRTFARL